MTCYDFRQLFLSKHHNPFSPRHFRRHHNRAAYCIPSSRPLVESGVVRQSIYEREDEHRDTQDYADLLPRGVSLFLVWLESYAMQSVSNQLMISVRLGIAGDFSRASRVFSSAGRSNRPNMRRTASSGPSPTQAWYDSLIFLAWTPCRRSSVRCPEISLRQRMSPLYASVR